LQVSPLKDSRDETWRGQGIRKRSVSWNLPKLRKIWRCKGGCGRRTTENNLRTKQFVSGKRNSNRVAACALRKEQAGRAIGRDCRACAASILSLEDVCAECARQLTEASAIPGSRDLLTSEGSWQKFLPHAMAPSTQTNLEDSLPTDMLTSAVPVLVVALPSSEVPEGLINYSV
jgi:hypothetical protein